MRKAGRLQTGSPPHLGLTSTAASGDWGRGGALSKEAWLTPVGKFWSEIWTRLTGID